MQNAPQSPDEQTSRFIQAGKPGPWRARLTGAFLTGCCLLATAPAARATWYSENIADGSDIIMMDLRWPWWPSGSYFANWNSGFNPKPNNLSFYAGFTSYLPDGPDQTPNPDAALQDSFRPGSVWTFWGSSADGTPVRFVDVAPNLFIKNTYGGEGSSGTVGGVVWPFMQRQRWYTMLGRVWKPEDNADHAFCARWIKDHADGTWHLIGIARLPIPAESFTGNSGFLEPLGSEKAVRSLHRRLGYFRKAGQWGKSDTISIDKTQYVIVNTVAEGDHEYAAIDYAQRPDLLPRELQGRPLAGDRKHSFTVRQPDKPALDQPAVTNVRAVASAGHVAVSWDVPATAAPAFAVKVEVFDNAECAGNPAAVRTERMPSLRDVLLAVPGRAARVRLTLTDVFDQEATPAVVEPAMVKIAAPAPVAVPETEGLAYELYHKDSQRRVHYFNPPQQVPDEKHYWLTLDELPQGRLVQRGLARGFDTSVRGGRDQGCALVFSGLLLVPEDGPYIFRAGIDGAFRLTVGGENVLVRDAQHGTTQQAAVCVLAKGAHPLTLTHVLDTLPAQNFHLEWEGPGFTRQPVPLQALRPPPGGNYPAPVLTAASAGDGTGRIQVETAADGHKLNRTALFLGTLQLSESAGPSLEYSGPLPAGKVPLWARVFYDDNHTVDAAPATLEVSGPQVTGWTVRNVGDSRALAGLWPDGQGGVRFFGSGMHTVTRRITGDFTATCRLGTWNGAQGEPVNARAWTGLTAREHGERLNWEWGRDFHLVQTARDGLRTAADFTDFGAGRISSYALPQDRPWLRIMRQGHIWTAWTSTDGKAWELGGLQYRKAQAEMDAGLFFSALPQEARAHYHAAVPEFTVVPGAASDSQVPAPQPARHTEGDRFTGIVAAPGHPQIAVLRSSAAGLLRTTDSGATWTACNGTLTGDDLCVRSAAIHPQNPDIMLRATGKGAAGRLWMTEDAGRSWRQLPLECDFDGAGPSALCGEVVAFDLRDPRVLYAGGESRGFFRSGDNGATWKLIGAAGERITSVTVWPWERHYPAPAGSKPHICVTTCPDSFMGLLGRGEPQVKTAAAVARSYLSSDGVQTIAVSDERSDTGFYNAAFDKALQSVNEMRYATSHGLQTQVFSGAQMALYAPQKHLEWLRPFTAVAAAARGPQKFGRFFTQALDPAVPGRYSRSEQWAFEFSWLEPQGDKPSGGLIAAAADQEQGEVWWFLHTGGLYHSGDGGRSLRKIPESALQPTR